ncbi:MAG: hypothetical protein ACRCX8_05765 [Sarcina sp.]
MNSEKCNDKVYLDELENKRANSRKYYWQKVSEHRCTLCGEKLDESYPYRKCRSCLDFNWDKRKQTQKDDPFKNVYQNAYYARNKEKIQSKNKELREYRIANKLCLRCGKHVKGEFQKCYECRKRQSAYKRNRRKELKNEGT